MTGLFARLYLDEDVSARTAEIILALLNRNTADEFVNQVFYV